MKGDILIITENHRKAAQHIYDLVIPVIENHEGKYLISVAGESGAGKSEIASALKNLLQKKGIAACIIQQDDYFEYPPETNARMRKNDIGRVGSHEVRIDLINDTVDSILAGINPVRKPLVIFSEDRLTSEEISFEPYRVVILEGTYTSLVNHIHCRVFIDRNLEDTRQDRLKRNREKQDDYLEQILRIEHQIISQHKALADIIITRQFTAVAQK